jgi:ELP3 family radical SAM enzyme/protein acetyltransferase
MFSKQFANNYAIEHLEKIFNKEKYEFTFTEEDENIIEKILKANYGKITNGQTYQTHIMKPLKYKYRKPHIVKIYRSLLIKQRVERDLQFERNMAMKATRGHSGVNVITIFTSGTQFGTSETGNDVIKNGGCPKNCHYCPFEKDENGIPTQPRSYLSPEPGNLRATQNLHHPVGQMFDRIYTLESIGHISACSVDISKLEIIISGGTFNFYPIKYIEWFVTCMYFAANIYYEYRDTNILPRDILSLEEEQNINETASLRVIGLTIETRPDYLNPRDYMRASTVTNDMQYDNLRYFRKLGITRVQIGIQHTNNAILKYINRECTNEINQYAIGFLKNNCFKVDIHIMLDLPSSSPDDDMIMLDEILNNPNYEADQWKIYPTEITNFTKIKEWYDNGIYLPYAEIDNGKLLKDVIIHAKKHMKPWIRINRVVRDIPVESIEGGISCPDLRGQIEQQMKIEGWRCNCIRCREIKQQKIQYENVVEKIRQYEASDGMEYFISYETPDSTVLLGYIRLRLNNSMENTMPELRDCAFIRELHVLGNHLNVGAKSDDNTSQHRGYGKRLIAKAEELAKNNNFKKIAIIAGVGVRDYYRKQGYYLENTFMMKNLLPSSSINNIVVLEKNTFQKKEKQTTKFIQNIGNMAFQTVCAIAFDSVFGYIISMIN